MRVHDFYLVRDALIAPPLLSHGCISEINVLSLIHLFSVNVERVAIEQQQQRELRNGEYRYGPWSNEMSLLNYNCIESMDHMELK